jgi:cytochrome c biogenesis protein ResB
MALKDTPPAKDPEANLTGLTFQIKDMKEQSGTYIAFEGMPEPVLIKANGKQYKIIFGKQQRILPFSVRLVDFKRDVYPGTDKARGYSSDIVIIDGNLEWPERIEMNKPLRYKGYTFYQSSFEQADAMQATILSVVENKGRLFPYISTLIIAVGLLLHIGIILRLEKT